MKTNRLLAAGLTAAALVCGGVFSNAAINKGFFKNAAKKAWALKSGDMFNPQVEIPDSLKEGNSAVVIAKHTDFQGKRVERNTIYSSTGRTNLTSLAHITRIMVKLLDNSAVEYFGDFEFENVADRKHYGMRPMEKEDNAFGLRVHKADGTINEIDVNTALEIGDGKKGDKNVRYKLPVPGLEPGDVVEYFYYTEYECEGGDIEPIDCYMAGRYPIMKGLITGKFSPDLTTEFRSYNGAPDIEKGKDGDFYTARLEYAGMPPVTFEKFLFQERQLPFIRLNEVNNYIPTGSNIRLAASARKPGLYSNVNPGRIHMETLENIARLAYRIDRATGKVSTVRTKANKYFKNWASVHPQATPRELADAAWIALRYANYTADDEDFVSPSLLLALFHNEMIDNLDLFEKGTTGIGFVNGRDEVPVEEMARWDLSNFASVVGDTTYVMKPGFSYLPGEVPALMQGENCVMVLGTMHDVSTISEPVTAVMPDRRHIGNKCIEKVAVSLPDADADKLLVSQEVTMTGSLKDAAGDFIDWREWVDEAEDFLGIEKSKKYKPKNFDPQERLKELREAFRDCCAELRGVAPDSIGDFEIVSRGVMPGKDAFIFKGTCEVSGLVEDMGDALSVKLGTLYGKSSKLEGAERERLLDAMVPSAYTRSVMLTFDVPEGYTVDETSLAKFSRQIVNPAGRFTVTASLNPEGDVSVVVMERIAQHTVPLQAWPLLRDLYDAMSEFNDASIVLKRNS